MRKIDSLGILLALLFANTSAFSIEIDQILDGGRGINCGLSAAARSPFKAFFTSTDQQSLPKLYGNSIEEVLFDVVRKVYGKELILHPRVLEEIQQCSRNHGAFHVFRRKGSTDVSVHFRMRTPGASYDENFTKFNRGYKANFHAAVEEALNLAPDALLDPDVRLARDGCSEIKTQVRDTCPSLCLDVIKIVSDYLTGY